MKGVILYTNASSVVIFENSDGIGRLEANMRSYDLRIGDSVWFHPVSEGLCPLTQSEIEGVWRSRETLEWTERQYGCDGCVTNDFVANDVLEDPSKHVKIDPPATLTCAKYSIVPDTTPIFKINQYLSTVGQCYDPDERRMQRMGNKTYYRVGFVAELLKRFQTVDELYKRLSEFAVEHRDYDKSFLTSGVDNVYIGRPIYVREEQQFFRNWCREVLDRSVRLYNLEPKEIYRTGYKITEITDVLWKRPHMLIGIDEGVLRRLQKTLKINTSADNVIDREMLLWVDSESSLRNQLGVTFAEIKRKHPTHIDRFMRMLGVDLEIVMIPKSPGKPRNALKLKETALIMTKSRYETCKYISTKINELSASSEMYTCGTVAIKDRKLDAAQREAVRVALRNNFYVVTGPAGSGKTTIIRTMTENLDEWDKKWILLAFTGIASYNMRKKVDTDRTSTIDLLLTQLQRKKGIKEFKELRHIIVDEASMVSAVTFLRLLRAVHEYGLRAKITLIGDPNQLPPVGAGITFETLIEYNLVRKSELKVVHRTKNEPDNTLYLNSMRIANAERGLVEGDEFIITKGTEKDVFAKARAMLAGGYRPSEIKVLCPYRKITEWRYGSATDKLIIDLLNAGLQEIMNPEGRQIPGTGLRVGDQVMVTVNDHGRGVFNGSQGIVVDFDDKSLTIEFEGRKLSYSLKKSYTKRKESEGTEEEERKASQSISDLTLGYALTIHKSQGMEWPLVLIYIPPGKKATPEFLNRQLLYTGVTRAKEIVMIVCDGRGVVESIAAMDPAPKWDPLSAMIEPWGGTSSKTS